MAEDYKNQLRTEQAKEYYRQLDTTRSVEDVVAMSKQVNARAMLWTMLRLLPGELWRDLKSKFRPIK